MQWKQIYGAIFRSSPKVVVWKALSEATELSVDDKVFIRSTLMDTKTNRERVDDYAIKTGNLRVHDVHERKGYLIWVLTIMGVPVQKK